MKALMGHHDDSQSPMGVERINATELNEKEIVNIMKILLNYRYYYLVI